MDIRGDVILSSLRADTTLQPILQPVSRERWFLDRLAHCRKPHDYATELQKIIENLAKSSESLLKVIRNTSFTFPMWICDGIAQVGYDKLSHVDRTFNNLVMRFTDSSNRKHEYTIGFKDQDYRKKPQVSVAIPTELDISWSWEQAYPRFCDLVREVEGSIDSYTSFFEVLVCVYTINIEVLLFL